MPGPCSKIITHRMAKSKEEQSNEKWIILPLFSLVVVSL